MLGSIVWDVDPVLVHIGSLEIRWYGLMWGLGFIFAYEFMSRLFKREKYPDNSNTQIPQILLFCFSYVYI